MIKEIIGIPAFRNFIDSIPDNKCSSLLRVLSKSLLFRKNIIRVGRLIFHGIGDAICESFMDVGNGTRELLIQTLATAVSPGTERSIYLDLPNFHHPRPYIPGYSGCGQVRSVGKNVTGFKRGDLVAGILKHSSLNVVAGESVAPVPPEVAPREAAFTTLGVISLCGMRAAGNLMGLKVAVVGQGILGQLADQVTRIEGASSIVGIAAGSSKREMAEESGVDEFVAISETKDSLSVIAADVVIDSTGSLRGFEDALKMVKPGGRVVMLGSIAAYAEKSDWARVVVEKDIEIRGAHIRNLATEGLTYREEAEKFLNLLAGEKIKLGHLITDISKPEAAPEIYLRLAKGDRKMVGVVIDWRNA